MIYMIILYIIVVFILSINAKDLLSSTTSSKKVEFTSGSRSVKKVLECGVIFLKVGNLNLLGQFL